WNPAKIPARMTPHEAHFWLAALPHQRSGKKPEEVADLLAKEKREENPSDDEVLRLVAGVAHDATLSLLLLGPRRQVGPGRFLHLVLQGQGWLKTPEPGHTSEWHQAVLERLFNDIIPRASDEELEQVRALARARLASHPWPTDPNEQADVAWYVG